MRFILPLFALATTGCGSADPVAACEDYVSAYNACITEFDGSETVNASFCLAYNGLSGSDAKDAEAALDCGTSGIELIDCSVNVGTELAAVLIDCEA